MTKPTIYLTNWSARRLHGPGRKWTIMVRPRAWERGEGSLYPLLPMEEDLLSVKAGTMSIEHYRARCETRFTTFAESLAPGQLRAGGVMFAGRQIIVGNGDTACCACSVADAAAGRCHRAWAAPFLVRAGWRVILDGQEVVL